MKLPLLTLVIFLGGLASARSQRLFELASLYSDLFAKYDNEQLPVEDLSETLFVNASATIKSINQFDEHTGQLEVTMVITLMWTESRMTWNPANYGGIKDVLIAVSDVWHPRFQIQESVTTMQEIGDASHQVRLSKSGEMSWIFGNVLQVFCSVDVTFFPFDKQTCTVSFSSEPYLAREVSIGLSDPTMPTDSFKDNSMWELESGYMLARSNHAFSAFDMMFNLKRRSEFYVIYIIVPLVILGILNSCVFIMPRSSGERHSVAVTMFLAFILYMNVINSTVPQSSSPLAYIYYYILFLILHSSMTMFLCIVSMRVYDCEGPVPDKIQTAILTLRCRICKLICRRGNVEPEKGNSHTDGIELPEKGIYEEEKVAVENDKDAVTWTHVGKTFDNVCLLGLLLFFIIYSAVTFLRLYHNVEFW